MGTELPPIKLLRNKEQLNRHFSYCTGIEGRMLRAPTVFATAVSTQNDRRHKAVRTRRYKRIGEPGLKRGEHGLSLVMTRRYR